MSQGGKVAEDDWRQLVHRIFEKIPRPENVDSDKWEQVGRSMTETWIGRMRSNGPLPDGVGDLLAHGQASITLSLAKQHLEEIQSDTLRDVTMTVQRFLDAVRVAYDPATGVHRANCSPMRSSIVSNGVRDDKTNSVAEVADEAQQIVGTMIALDQLLEESAHRVDNLKRVIEEEPEDFADSAPGEAPVHVWKRKAVALSSPRTATRRRAAAALTSHWGSSRD